MAKATPKPARGDHYGLRHVLVAEWTKLRTVRSTAWSLIIIVALTFGIGALATSVQAARWAHLSLADRIRFDPVRLSLTGILLAQLAVGVLGILMVTAEYGTGTIRATLAAVPRRLMVLVSKVVVFAVVALVVSEVVCFGAFFLGQWILAGRAPHATLGQPGVLQAVGGSGLYLGALGLIGLGLAVIIRHTAAAIAVFVVVLFILPLVLNALPQSVINAVAKYLPANMGLAMISLHPFREMPLFGPWTSFAILVGYGMGLLVIGAVTLVRRDA